ncbi:REV3 [Symbiodinium natans]|uniref:DNA polymerase n=1 Tax=Symbiodinium natans TaxID=878477 RepID=A0A812RG18_9DINO|nr:REV3 [Symbiodinium natans]
MKPAYESRVDTAFEGPKLKQVWLDMEHKCWETYLDEADDDFKGVHPYLKLKKEVSQCKAIIKEDTRREVLQECTQKIVELAQECSAGKRKKVALSRQLSVSSRGIRDSFILSFAVPVQNHDRCWLGTYDVVVLQQVTIVSLDFYLTKPGLGDQARSQCTGKAFKEVPVIRVFGYTDTGQTACTHVHGIFPFFYVQVSLSQIEEIGQENGKEGFLQAFADGLEHAVCLHQASLVTQRANSPALVGERAYLHDLRWVTGWQSVYGYGNRAENTEEHFIQIWVAQPQYTGLMAHLLQQGAVLSMSFQPFEVHLPYLLHFLDSFGLGGMRELVVDPARVALRGELPEQALSTFPWHPLWASKLGSSARERLLCCRGQKPWWCDKAASETRPKSVHPRTTTCEVEVDCSATDILPPLSSTASEIPTSEAQEATVHDCTRGWICDTLRELWRDEEQRCTVMAQAVPWDRVPLQPGVPGHGAAALTPDVMDECMLQRLKSLLEGQNAPAQAFGESASPSRGTQAMGVWSQQDVVQVDTKSKVSPKFVKALETLEAAMSQQMTPPDEATATLLHRGYQQSEPQEDTATEPDTDCGATELDELENEAASEEAETAECAPTQLDAAPTQADFPDCVQGGVQDQPDKLAENVPLSPMRPAELFPLIAEAACSSEQGPLPPAKGFYSEPDDLDLGTTATEQAGVWEYWQPPPTYEATARSKSKRQPDEEEGDDVITKFDNAGRLTTLRRKATTGNQGKRLGRKRQASLSEATAPTPAPPKPLRQAADAPPLFGTLLTVEVLELPAQSPQGPSLIGAVAFCLRDERVRCLLAEEDQDYEDGLGLICIEGTQPLEVDPKVLVKEVASEQDVFVTLADIFREADPSVVMGYDIVKGSLGRLISRAQELGIRGFPEALARAASSARHGAPQALQATAMSSQVADIPGSPAEQTGAPRKLYPPEQVSGGLELPGRLVLNVWRVLRGEAKLPTSSLHTAAQILLGEILPFLPPEALARRWRSSVPHRRREAAETLLCKAKCSLRLLDALNVLPRAAETARMLGIDVLSVLSRGSQYRVEGLLTRAAHQERMLLLSPSRSQVAGQRGAECIPLVMEPRSGFYFDPVVVLDFQSLYPSIIIAYNLCFSTCAGRLQDIGAEGRLGVLEAYRQTGLRLQDVFVTPNEAVFVKRAKKPGILPRMLHEILQTRIMVKKALKALQKDTGDAEARARLLDARQFGLKMIANVTYGYTGASFSGRMPCVELADAIVQTARRTLERAVRWVEKEVPGAEVLYGDTDSMFVRLPGRSKDEAFKEGARIAREVTSHNPTPVELQMDKVYWPCCLASKKRYVGHAWTSPSDAAPVFDAKGIETVRRDQCTATQHMLRGALEVFFESRGNLSILKQYIRRHVDRIREGRFNLQDFIFHHEVRPPDEYKGHGPLAAQAVRRSGVSWPSPGERFSFVIAEGPPGSRLADVAVVPGEVTGGRPLQAPEAEAGRTPLFLNVEYYLERQIGPALHRLFMLVRGPNGLQGQVDIRRWIAEGPRPRRRDVAAISMRSSLFSASAMLSSMAAGFICQACGQKTGARISGTVGLCGQCQRGGAVERLLEGMSQRGYWEKRVQGCREMCMRCSNSTDIEEDCRSIYCTVFFRKVNAHLQLSACVSPKSWPAAADW